MRGFLAPRHATPRFVVRGFSSLRAIGRRYARLCEDTRGDSAHGPDTAASDSAPQFWGIKHLNQAVSARARDRATHSTDPGRRCTTLHCTAPDCAALHNHNTGKYLNAVFAMGHFPLLPQKRTSFPGHLGCIIKSRFSSRYEVIMTA